MDEGKASWVGDGSSFVRTALASPLDLCWGPRIPKSQILSLLGDGSKTEWVVHALMWSASEMVTRVCSMGGGVCRGGQPEVVRM